jgi:glycosyl transferase, family 25
MRREFERIGVEFDRVPAVDGTLVDQKIVEDFERNRLGVYPEKWLPGEIGCFLSHFDVWQRIVASEAAFAAVFEDDIHVAEDLRPLLTASDWIPPHADIVRLETYHKMRVVDGRRIEIAPRRKVFRAASSAKGSCGYIISRQASERLLSVNPEFHCWLDIFLFHPGRSPIAGTLQVYQVAPAVCVQDQFLRRPAANIHSLIEIGKRAPRARSAGLWTFLKELLPWRRRRIEFRP